MSARTMGSLTANTRILKDYQIVLFGDGGVGKSALTSRFVDNVFSSDYDPTIEDSYQKDILIDNEVILLNILDTAGQEAYRALQEQYCRHGDGFLILYSITSRESLNYALNIHQDIIQIRGHHVPVVLVGTKCDLMAEREVSQLDSTTLSSQLCLPLVETSSKLGLNVEAAFATLTREIRQMKITPPQQKTETTELDDAADISFCGGCVLV